MNEGCPSAPMSQRPLQGEGTRREGSAGCMHSGPQHFLRSWPPLLTRQEEVGEASGRMEETHKTFKTV